MSPNPTPRRRLRLTCLLFALVAFSTLPARATTLDPDVILRAQAPLEALAEGEAFAIPVDVYVRQGVPRQEVRVRSEVPSASLRLDPVLMRQRPAAAPGYDHERVVLRGRLESGLDRVRVQVVANGEEWEESFSLREFGDPTEDPIRVDDSSPTLEARVDVNGLSKPAVDTGRFPAQEVVLSRAARTVTVTGRIVMRIEDVGTDRGVDGATVMLMRVRDILDDEVIAQQTADANGDFSLVGTVDGTPDIYLKVRAANGAANIGTDLFFTTYSRNSAVFEDFAGSSIAFGNVRWRGDMNHALFLLSTYTRMQRWFSDLGYDLPPTNVRWRDDVLQSSCYLPLEGLRGVHLRSSATWFGRTIVHEYGHHFVDTTEADEVWPPFYLNGICDPSHCGDCPENEAVAWSEGFPNFLQQEFATHHLDTYGWGLPSTSSYENLADCDETESFADDPQSTENFFAAMLNDLIDTNADGSTLAPGVIEASELDITDILTVATTYDFSNSLDFVTSMRDYLNGPGFTDVQRSEFYAAAAINGFADDTTPPTSPTISAPFNPIGVETSAVVPTFFFSDATDDDSGVAGYRIDVANAPGPPGAGAIEIDLDSISWPFALSPGWWYANVRTVDRAGNQSSTRTYGPMVIGAAGQVDLALSRPGLWEDEVIVRHDASATATAAAVETTLLADTDTWLSFTSSNVSSSSAAVSPFSHLVRLDGSNLAFPGFSPGTMIPGQEFQVLNNGPFRVPGGRHNFTFELDYRGDVPEAAGSNLFQRSLVFRPGTVTAGAAVGPFAAPPRSFTVLGQALPNVTGHRITPTNQFAAAVMRTETAGADYGMRVYDAISTGPNDGFENTVEVVNSEPGRAEVLIVNRQILPGPSFDFGIQRASEGSESPYTFQHTSSEPLSVGASGLQTWPAGDLIWMKEFTFNDLQLGTFNARFRVFWGAEGPGEVEVHWIPPTTGAFDLQGATPAGVVDDSGDFDFELPVTAGGTYALVAFRDLPSGVDAPSLTVSFTSDQTPLVDLRFDEFRNGWDLPVVPSIDLQQGPDVPEPTELIGESFETYLNIAIENVGPIAAPGGVEITADLDDVPAQQFFFGSLPAIPARGEASSFAQFPVFVPGGRHSIEFTIDPQGTLQERPGPNFYVAQFGWRGLDLGLWTNMARNSPPDPSAGRLRYRILDGAEGIGGEEGEVLPLNPWFPNSDGMRLPEEPNAPHWTMVGTMPAVNEDVDLHLHEVMPPRLAFGPDIVSSNAGRAQVDFVLIDRSVAGTGEFDVSVRNVLGTDGYRIEQVDSQPLGNIVEGVAGYPGFGIDGPGFLALHRADLPAGTYDVTVVPKTADANLGLSVHLPTTGLDKPFRSKDTAIDLDLVSTSSPAGDLETVVFEIEEGQEGTVAIAVFKESAGDLLANVDYDLQIGAAFAPEPCVAVDGLADSAYGASRASQTVQTDFGDADGGQADAANGSELNELWATFCEGTLYLTLSGNLESNYNDLELFLDTRPGGQNRLRGDNADFGDIDDFNRMGDDGSGNGFTFEPGFEADWWFSFQGGFGEVWQGIPYRLAAYRAELLTQGGGEGTYLGATVAGARGRLALPGESEPATGVRVAIDNSNGGGVTAGTGPDSGEGVRTGVEIAIPLTEIGSPTQCVRLVAFVNGKRHDFVSNQFLPPLAPGIGNPGDPRDVDLGALPGQQYEIVCLGTSTGVDSETPRADVMRVALMAPAPNPFNPRTEIAFALPRAASVNIDLFDVAGRRVRSLVTGESFDAGTHALVWDGTDARGQRVSSGTYLVRLQADDEEHTRRVTMLK